MPYDVSPYALYDTCRLLLEAINGFDLLYCHDGGLCIEFVKNIIPTVISIRDFCYQETLLGALNFNQSALIVNSDHTYHCLIDTFARINPSIKGKIHLIYNGYNPIFFAKQPTDINLLKQMGLPEKKDFFAIGFPHRPQKEKGIANAIHVVNKLKKSHPNIRLLIPLYMDISISTRTDDTYKFIREQIIEHNLQDIVIFHPWIKPQQMSQYYSYCDVVLNIGDFVESFSNVAVESLLCETPVIAFDIATYRTIPIKRFIKIVDYGDIDTVSNIIADMIVRKKDGNPDDHYLKQARLYISETLSPKKFVDQYEELFKQIAETANTTAKKSSHPLPSARNYYRLTAWCSYSNGYFYNDYDKKLYEDKFQGLLRSNTIPVPEELLLSNNISKETIHWFESQGIIVKVSNEE